MGVPELRSGEEVKVERSGETHMSQPLADAVRQSLKKEQEALQKLLTVLERLEEEPELILTDLFDPREPMPYAWVPFLTRHRYGSTGEAVTPEKFEDYLISLLRAYLTARDPEIEVRRADDSRFPSRIWIVYKDQPILSLDFYRHTYCDTVPELRRLEREVAYYRRREQVELGGYRDHLLQTLEHNRAQMVRLGLQDNETWTKTIERQEKALQKVERDLAANREKLSDAERALHAYRQVNQALLSKAAVWSRWARETLGYAREEHWMVDLPDRWVMASPHRTETDTIDAVMGWDPSVRAEVAQEVCRAAAEMGQDLSVVERAYSDPKLYFTALFNPGLPWDEQLKWLHVRPDSRLYRHQVLRSLQRVAARWLQEQHQDLSVHTHGCEQFTLSLGIDDVIVLNAHERTYRQADRRIYQNEAELLQFRIQRLEEDIANWERDLTTGGFRGALGVKDLQDELILGFWREAFVRVWNALFHRTAALEKKRKLIAKWRERIEQAQQELSALQDRMARVDTCYRSLAAWAERELGYKEKAPEPKANGRRNPEEADSRAAS